MKAVFADTFFYLAFISRADVAHPQAVRLFNSLKVPIVTTAWILTEVGDALADPKQRPVFLTLYKTIQADSNISVVPPTRDLFEKGVEFFARRPDKEWSLTDCISFVVMEQRGITEALTGDHHFEQAGFRVLLR